MKKAGIAIDVEDRSIFERHLTQSGYKFAGAVPLTSDTELLMVETENTEALAEVLKAAMDEARRTRPWRSHENSPAAHTTVN